jgi:hypothetical protein
MPDSWLAQLLKRLQIMSKFIKPNWRALFASRSQAIDSTWEGFEILGV